MHKVLYVEYQVRTKDGELVDETQPGEPMPVHLGTGEVLEGFENAVKDLAVGQSADFQVPPEEGYGVRDEGLLQEVPLSEFPDGMRPESGMVFTVEDNDGHTGQFMVSSVGLESATCDFNHPLAGQHLDFHVTVVKVEEHEDDDHSHQHHHHDGCQGCGHDHGE
jgi:FKBP-type peptidyl-prolyl cis-trans isomerase 2